MEKELFSNQQKKIQTIPPLIGFPEHVIKKERERVNLHDLRRKKNTLQVLQAIIELFTHTREKCHEYFNKRIPKCQFDSLSTNEAVFILEQMKEINKQYIAIVTRQIDR